ncbi:hypothetical protein G5T42_12700 [Microbacterium sp. 4R-513]|uniref:hypothetical protein n=1 Tax=Microbacterium sp. 4R-513 TaxID=2567934 RepID=UPI0013E1FB62|nr:hypothetical protein [Microbacterium sp. 4R-513]QIG40233.1 hypothetical protein G5T42_12700 [Microbacterium sp. 4R-513]
MDGRAAFAAGGFIAGAAAVAVACAVTLSNAAALADAPGEAADVEVVRVTPAAPTPTASATLVAPVVPAPAPTAEVVPAPEPQDVAAPSQTQRQSTAPAPQVPAGQTPSGPSEQQIADDAIRSGSWDDLRSWAEQHGWSAEKITRWIEQLERAAADRQGQDAQRNASIAPTDTERTASVGESSRKSLQAPQAPAVQAPQAPAVQAPQAPVVNPPQTDTKTNGHANGRSQAPAKNAGSPSTHGNSSSSGWKRDQSPKPPRGD